MAQMWGREWHSAWSRRFELSMKWNIEIVLFFLLEFFLLYWWLVLVKLQALVEQIWERDTHNLKVEIQKKFQGFELFFAFASLVFATRSFVTVSIFSFCSFQCTMKYIFCALLFVFFWLHKSIVLIKSLWKWTPWKRRHFRHAKICYRGLTRDFLKLISNSFAYRKWNYALQYQKFK